jgi:hypothetical protein
VPIAIVTLELNDDSEYGRVCESLKDLGLSEHTPVRDVRLSGSTLLGHVEGLGTTAEEIRDELSKRIHGVLNREPPITVGLLFDWAIRSGSKSEEMIEGVF